MKIRFYDLNYRVCRTECIENLNSLFQWILDDFSVYIWNSHDYLIAFTRGNAMLYQNFDESVSDLIWKLGEQGIIHLEILEKL